MHLDLQVDIKESQHSLRAGEISHWSLKFHGIRIKNRAKVIIRIERTAPDSLRSVNCSITRMHMTWWSKIHYGYGEKCSKTHIKQQGLLPFIYQHNYGYFSGRSYCAQALRCCSIFIVSQQLKVFLFPYRIAPNFRGTIFLWISWFDFWSWKFSARKFSMLVVGMVTCCAAQRVLALVRAGG